MGVTFIRIYVIIMLIFVVRFIWGKSKTMQMHGLMINLTEH